MMPWYTNVAALSGGGSAPVAGPTWDPANKSDLLSLSADKLTATGDGGEGFGATTLAMTAGQKIWAEFENVASSDNTPAFGLANASMDPATVSFLGQDANSLGAYDNGVFAGGNALAAAFATSAGDIVNMAVDVDAGTVALYLNGVLVDTYTHGITGDLYFATDCKLAGSIQIIAPGSYTNAAPTGFTEYGAA